jgi:hypothetical protein
MRRELGIARCGLGCCVCIAQNDCEGCNSDLCRYKDYCQNRKCTIGKGLRYCAECSETDCRKDVLKDLRPRAFNEFIRRYGAEKLMDCLERNEAAGIVYHRSETDLYGDYDVPDTMEGIIRFILTGEKPKKGPGEKDGIEN